MAKINISGSVFHIGSTNPCVNASIEVWDLDEGGNGNDRILQVQTNNAGSFSGQTANWVDSNTKTVQVQRWEGGSVYPPVAPHLVTRTETVAVLDVPLLRIIIKQGSNTFTFDAPAVPLLPGLPSDFAFSLPTIFVTWAPPAVPVPDGTVIVVPPVITPIALWNIRLNNTPVNSPAEMTDKTIVEILAGHKVTISIAGPDANKLIAANGKNAIALAQWASRQAGIAQSEVEKIIAATQRNPLDWAAVTVIVCIAICLVTVVLGLALFAVIAYAIYKDRSITAAQHVDVYGTMWWDLVIND